MNRGVQRALCAAAVLLVLAYLGRYSISASTSDGINTTAVVLDRWTGTVTVCTLLTCYQVYPQKNFP